MGDGAALEILDGDDDPKHSSLTVIVDEIRARLGPNWVDEVRRRAYRS